MAKSRTVGSDGYASKKNSTQAQADAGYPHNFYCCSACLSILEQTANGAHCPKCKKLRPVNLTPDGWARQRRAFQLGQAGKGRAAK